MEITLGEKYRDTVTGFEGTATATSTFLTGCVRIMLEAGDEKGQPQEFWFDEQRLESVNGEAVVHVAKAGGPRPDAPRTGLR